MTPEAFRAEFWNELERSYVFFLQFLFMRFWSVFLNEMHLSSYGAHVLRSCYFLVRGVQDSIRRRVEAGDEELHSMLEMIYDSSFPESQVPANHLRFFFCVSVTFTSIESSL